MRDGRAYAAAAIAAAALTFVVIVASAYLRHAQAIAVGAAGIGVVRGAHRVAATGVSLVLLLMLWLAFRRRAQRGWTIAAFALVAGLSVLGIGTPGARLPAVALANLLGGLALLAVFAAGYASAAPAAAIAPPVRRLAAIGVALVLVQALLGGLIATQSALLACPSLPVCELPGVSEFLAGESWNPWRAPTAGAPAGAAWLHVLHRVNGIVLAAIVLVTVVRLWRPRGRLAVLLGLALASTIGAGIAAALVPTSLGAAVAHNAAAALLIALLACVATADPVGQPNPAIAGVRHTPHS
ncbi:MAG: COX15/CtaA family protein [Burkholderiales bacterium]|nr:COX15/CtaA family protein [Burkholderiales bacterium]